MTRDAASVVDDAALADCKLLLTFEDAAALGGSFDRRRALG
jgi:hypothetical protein